MEAQKCVYCSKELPNKGFFCSNCTKQVRCKECKEPLETDANACIYCGTLVTSKVEGVAYSENFPVMNVIEYHETRSTRSLKASLTDSVGNSLSGALGQIMAKGMPSKNLQSKFDKNNSVEDTFADIIEDNEEERIKNQPILIDSSPNPSTNDENQAPEKRQIAKLFRFQDDKTVLVDPRLKPTNKLDFAKRLVLLLLYGHKLNGKDFVLRSEVNQLLKDAGVYDGGTRQWIANSNFIRLDDESKSIEIIIPGIEEAKRYLAEINNSEIEGKWSVTTQPKHRKKTKQQVDESEEHE